MASLHLLNTDYDYAPAQPWYKTKANQKAKSPKTETPDNPGKVLFLS